MAVVGIVASLAIGTLFVPEEADSLGGIAMLIAYAASGSIALAKARRLEGRERRSWLMLGLGLVSAAVGVTVVAALEIASVYVPAFGPLDLFFLSAYVGILGGVLLLPEAFGGQRDTLRTLIDGIVGAISMGVLVWVFVLEDVVGYFRDASAWDRWLGTAYPLLDIATIVVFVTVLSRRSRYRMDPRLIFMAVGAGLQSLADLMYLSSGIGASFDEAEPQYVIFVSGALMFFFAARLADRMPHSDVQTRPSVHYFWSAGPYVIAVGLMVATLLALLNVGLGSETQLLTVSTIGVGLLVIFRQALAIRDNRIHVDQKRTDLVSSVSHELRTPLTALVGFLGLVADPDYDPPAAEQHELLMLAHREALRMSRIVGDVILLTRIEPEFLKLSEERVAVAELLDETLQVIDPDGTRIAVDVSEDLIVAVDRGRVRQLLVNLVENAVRYGNGSVEVVASGDDWDLTVEVHDNGPGVPKRDRSVIWDRFERGAHRFDAAIPGSGIGLSVVAAITAAHGGSATYRASDRLGGACFAVTLPGRIIGSISGDEEPVPQLHS